MCLGLAPLGLWVRARCVPARPLWALVPCAFARASLAPCVHWPPCLRPLGSGALCSRFGLSEPRALGVPRALLPLYAMAFVPLVLGLRVRALCVPSRCLSFWASLPLALARVPLAPLFAMAFVPPAFGRGRSAFPSRPLWASCPGRSSGFVARARHGPRASWFSAFGFGRSAFPVPAPLGLSARGVGVALARPPLWRRF